MKTNSSRQISSAGLIALCATTSGTACVIEKIDAIIAEHGVTYWPSSSGEEPSTTSTGSTSTSTSMSTSSEAAGHSEALDSSTTAELDTHDMSDGSSSTGAEDPFCGDGVIQGDETCDDGNVTPDDGCQECAKDSIVFISSEIYPGYELGGLSGADQRCRSLAAKAYLPRFETFRAWLSTPSMAASDRLLHSRGRYILVNGIVVAQNWGVLTSGVLQHPITVDEHSQTRDGYVWTGTLANGTPALGSEFCGDWEVNMGFPISGGVGRAVEMNSLWSFVDHDGCDADNRIYCIEQ